MNAEKRGECNWTPLHSYYWCLPGAELRQIPKIQGKNRYSAYSIYVFGFVFLYSTYFFWGRWKIRLYLYGGLGCWFVTLGNRSYVQNRLKKGMCFVFVFCICLFFVYLTKSNLILSYLSFYDFPCIYLSICLSVCLSIYLLCLSNIYPIYLFVCLSIYLSLNPSLNLLYL